MSTQQIRPILYRILSVSTVLLLALSSFGDALAQGPSTYVVNTADDVDDGACNVHHCSLREAINAANAHPGADTIAFKIRGGPPFTIQPGSALPEITDPVTIDGSTQPGFLGNPIVELDGTDAGEEVSGLVISAGDSTIRGLVINRFSGDGVVLTTNGGNTIQGNFIGTDMTGTVALSNFRGVLVEGGSSGNLIGGTGAHAGNLLSGNEGAGVRLSDAGTEGNKVQGNFIGTDLTGTGPLGNGLGVRITEGAADNLIGGTDDGARNVISGNMGEGVYIDIEEVEGTTGNIVQGNYIGTDANGAAALPNAGVGVGIASGASHTLIGGVDEGAGNLVSGNGGDGVSINDPETTGTVVQGNFIGTDASGTAALPNGADGVRIVGGASHTLIGGTEDGARNVISGNTYIGVSIWDTGTSDNIIQGNFIGTDASGTAALQNGVEGVAIYTGASNTLIGGTEDGARNIISGNGTDGVHIADPGTSENIVQGNFIGTDVSGMVALGNYGKGVNVEGGASGNLIGGTQAHAGNLISGNELAGIGFFGVGTEGNKVQGNLIGTDISGTSPLGNGTYGVRVTDGAANNEIGGTEDGACNVISGNIENGVLIDVDGTSGNKVQGNLIGTDLTGMSPLGNGSEGVRVEDGATDNLIGGMEEGARNVISDNYFAGVWISGNGTTGNTVQGNYIGTDRDGTGALANSAFGVVILTDATGNLIGGTQDGARNVISGNLYNVGIGEGGTTGNAVQGNYIGIDSSGSKALPNTNIGVLIIEGANGNLIGGTEDGARNIISGATRFGVAIANVGTTGNTVQGNFIGTDATGTMPLGNLNGVAIGGDAAGNLIGGTEPGAGNTIAFNGGAGIELGLDDDGIIAGSGNALLSNSVFENGGLGIDLGNDGVTPNDPLDQDSGPNDLQNFPIITTVRRVGRSVMIYGTLDSAPNTKFRLEFFSNDACDPSGFGEGQAFLGSAQVKTNQAGNWSFIITLPVPLPPGASVTATATDPAGSTSEFSNCVGPVR